MYVGWVRRLESVAFEAALEAYAVFSGEIAAGQQLGVRNVMPQPRLQRLKTYGPRVQQTRQVQHSFHRGDGAQFATIRRELDETGGDVKSGGEEGGGC